MSYFKCGDRVELKENSIYAPYFSVPTGVVVGYATMQSGVPCVLIDMDERAKSLGASISVVFTRHLVVPMDTVKPL
jgi:hypothetical protein